MLHDLRLTVRAELDAGPVVLGLAAWRTRVSQSFVTLEVGSGTVGAGFEGRITGARHGQVRADRVHVRSAPHTIQRSHAATRLDGGQLLVSVQLDGTCIVRQAGREALLHPSDMAIYDTSAPYELEFPEGVHAQCVLQVPRDVLGIRDVRDRTAVLVSGAEGVGSAVSALMAALPLALTKTDDARGAALVEHGLQLLRLTIGPEPEAAPPPQALFLAAMDCIRRRADDPALAPAEVAATVHVSLRHLHRVFAASGTSVSRELWDMRVARAARDLRDSQCRGATVAEVARRHGFVSAAHFSRAFTARMGATPGTWRAGGPDR